MEMVDDTLMEKMSEGVHSIIIKQNYNNLIYIYLYTI